MKYEFEPHSPIKIKAIPWTFCKYCGLLYLNNPLSKWCIKMGCNNSDHKEYNIKVNRLGKGRK